VTLEKTIDLLRSKGELRLIETPLDIKLEIPHLAYAEVKKPDGGKHSFLPIRLINRQVKSLIFPL
jgi:3-polyprenyl-4-hydroxybenzoate decarboxylase